MPLPERVFLDANILFSAAYREAAGLQRLWHVAEVQLLTSSYALEESRRNLTTGEQQHRLEQLMSAVELVEAAPRGIPRPENVVLPEKDWPILLAAIAHEATHLLTGDLRHFGPYLDRQIEGVEILLPATYLKSRA